MASISEQTFETVSDVVNDTFGDGMMDLPYEAAAVPAWRRLLVPALALLLALALLFFWRRRRQAAAAAAAAAAAPPPKKTA